MLYYTSLFLVIVLVSVIAIWMYRGILGVARITYNATMPNRRIISPAAKARLKSRQKARMKSSGVAARSTRSVKSKGRAVRRSKGNSHPVSAHGEVYKPGSTKVLWTGISEHSGVSESHASHAHSTASDNVFDGPASSAGRKNVGWPYKEEKMNYAGKAYKVNRKATEGDFIGDGKPWVW